MKLSVLTVNVHKGLSQFSRRFILPELRDAIRTSAVDIVCVQEVIGEHKTMQKQNTANWPTTTQYEYLADSVWDSHAYGRNAVYSEGHHGNAVLSKLPMTQWTNHDISSHGVEKRGLLHCVLNAQVNARHSNTALHLLCTHLSLAERNRQQETNKIIEYIHTLPEHDALVLAGDFNDWRGVIHRRIIEETGLREVHTQLKGSPARTFPAVFPLLQLDRIYVRSLRSFELKEIERQPWNRLSDHRPLATVINV